MDLLTPIDCAGGKQYFFFGLETLREKHGSWVDKTDTMFLVCLHGEVSARHVLSGGFPS